MKIKTLLFFHIISRMQIIAIKKRQADVLQDM